FTTQKLNATKIGVLYNNVDPFVLLVLDSFKNRVGENTTVLTEAYQPEDRDFRSQLAKLKKVDALLIIGFDEAGLAAKQAREVGITTPLLGIDTVLSEGYKTNAADAYEGMYFTSWTPSDKEKTKQFVKQYKSKFGEEPQQLLFAATGYDAAKQLFLALLENRATAKKQLSSLHTKGLTGELSMSPDGIVRSVEEKMHQIQMGQVVELS
ncbi:MAG TPA: ABC transporter substrate-binding protein, partial [Candidatus Nanoarchaeia archaeon]|nr:ABC transporter substrate-binding protein [Candidatus Nanoarchaeia archaeon]